MRLVKYSRDTESWTTRTTVFFTKTFVFVIWIFCIISRDSPRDLRRIAFYHVPTFSFCSLVGVATVVRLKTLSGLIYITVELWLFVGVVGKRRVKRNYIGLRAGPKGNNEFGVQLDAGELIFVGKKKKSQRALLQIIIPVCLQTTHSSCVVCTDIIRITRTYGYKSP